ncbi:helix-turn-helix transcriptional regulator [Streptomyces sp. ODS28]|uniref:helix-turn-helix domain-containing protein n=1 Tax=Streptomyces sp. ODS28 TaxID=3136688 RepID=UPI0031EFA79E
MSEARSPSGSTATVLRMILGKRLKVLREEAGLSEKDAAGLLHVNFLTVRRMERAETAFKIPYIAALLDAYGVGAQEKKEFLELAEQSNRPGWWHRFKEVLPDWFTAYVNLESDATTLRVYEPTYVTGLLQTRGYARALLRTGFPHDDEETLEHRVDLRLQRQSLLEKPDAPTLWVVMSEAALRTQVGGKEVMREQMDHLLETTSRLRNVSVDVVPFSAGPHSGAFGPFTYFRFEAVELPDVVYLESAVGGVYYEQRADVEGHLEAHNEMSLLTSTATSENLLVTTRKELYE